MKCFACGGKMAPVTTDIKTGWGKYDITIKNVKAYRCEKCDYEVYDPEEVAMIQNISQAYAESDSTNKPDILNVDEVADLLRITTQTVYNMIKDGRLKAQKVGREWRFVRSEVEKLLEPYDISLAARGKLTDKDAAFITKYYNSSQED